MNLSNAIPDGPRKFLWPWFGFLGVLMLLGIYGALHTVLRHEPPPVEWGMLVPSYVFFALAATGSSLVNSVFTVFGVERFRPLAKRGVLVSLLLILPPLLFICLELGIPWQMYNLYVFFQFDSRMSWMGGLYMIFMASLAVELVIVILENKLPHWVPKAIGWFVLTITLVVHTNLGALFGAVHAKAMWSTHLLPAHFIVSAVTAGAAVHILFTTVTYRIKIGELPAVFRDLFARSLAPLIVGLLGVNFVLVIEKFVAGAYHHALADATHLLAAGGYSVTFWGFEVLLGGIVPIVLLLHPATRSSAKGLLAAAVLVVLGVYFSKYDLVVAGQGAGALPLLEHIPYHPEFGELLLLFGGTAIALTLYTLGELLLPLDPDEEPVWLIFPARVMRLVPRSWLPIQYYVRDGQSD